MITKLFLIADGVNAIISSTDVERDYRITGTAALTSNWSVGYLGTPYNGEIRTIRYVAKRVTLGGNSISFLGASMPDEYVSKDINVICEYNGTSWDVSFTPDFDESDIINTQHIINDSITANKIGSSQIGNKHLVNGSVSETIIDTDAVTTIKILDANVTLPKLATQADNTVLVNVSGGVASPTALGAVASRFLGRLSAGALKFCTVAEVQTELAIRTTALASANLWVGNGGGVAAAVTPSGAVAMDNAGAFTIADSYVTPQMVGQKVVNSRNTGIVAVKIIEGAVLKALLDASLNDLCAFATGDTILRVLSTVQTPHGAPMTFDVGVDAIIRTAGADANGLVEAANGGAAGKYDSDNATYSGALLDFGQFTADAGGNLTITSTADASAGAFVGCITIYYLPA